MTTTTRALVLDPSDAEFEIARRKAPKGTPERTVPPTPEAKACFAMSTAELRALAGEPAPAKATRKAKARKPKGKPARSPEQVAATAARKAAWDFRAAEFKAGRKVSYADACAKFGVKPAKSA